MSTPSASPRDLKRTYVVGDPVWVRLHFSRPYWPGRIAQASEFEKDGQSVPHLGKGEFLVMCFREDVPDAVHSADMLPFVERQHLAISEDDYENFEDVQLAKTDALAYCALNGYQLTRKGGPVDDNSHKRSEDSREQRKKRKMNNVGGDDDNSPNEISPPIESKQAIETVAYSGVAASVKHVSYESLSKQELIKLVANKDRQLEANRCKFKACLASVLEILN